MSNETEVPVEVPVVEVLANTTEPKTVSLTQERLDAIIKERMGAAGKAAREEAERLKVENQRLKEVAAGQGSADELERVRGELASSRLEQAAILEASVKQQRDLVIAQESNKHGFVDVETLQKLTRGNLKHDATTGSFIVTNDDGTPRVGPDGTTPVSVSDFFQDFGNRKPWLVKGTVLPGTGQGSSTGTIPPRDPGWAHFVGPNSSARDANILCQTAEGKRRYAEYRRQARAAGAIQ